VRVVVSIQSKRGSSRGLVHYIAHSKIDPERESADSRGLFNGFSDSLDVKSSNNSLKIDTSRSRPSNDELHHLVLSFRREDFAKLGTCELERKRATKRITRAAMARLENNLNADKLSWAAAVHLNTANPHVHIAIQKQYFTNGLERKVLTKIPREAIPHYEKTPNGSRQFSAGFLIDAASEKLEEIVRQNEAREKRRPRTRNHTTHPTSSTEERVLAQGLLSKFALKESTKKFETLTQHGNKMQFRVFDAVTGRKRRMSLENIEHRAAARAPDEIRRGKIVDSGITESVKQSYFDSELDLNAGAVRQIRTILFKLTAKEEARRQHFERKSKASDKQVNAIRSACRREGRKLPTPALTKNELDRLQDQCLTADDLRSFAYLERVRSELSAAGRIVPRDAEDTQRLSALKVIFALRSDLHKKHATDLQGNRFVRFVNLDGTRWSLSELEKRGDQHALGRGLLDRLGFGTKRQSPTREQRTNNALSGRIVERLDLEQRQVIVSQKREEKKVKLIEGVLKTAAGQGGGLDKAVFNSHQLAEMESLSFRLKNPAAYDRSWDIQKLLIEQAGSTSRIGRKIFKSHSAGEAEKVFANQKERIIAGRALAREIISRIQLQEAKSNLKRFSQTKQFHKFEVINERAGTRDFISLKDVEISRSGSLLNQAVNYLSESRERRSVRKAVRQEIIKKEKNLKDELRGAREIFDSASRVAADYKQVSIFGLKSSPVQTPLFTSSELAIIERRITHSADSKERRGFEKVLGGARANALESLETLLRGFEPDFGQSKHAVGRERENPIGPSMKLENERGKRHDSQTHSR